MANIWDNKNNPDFICGTRVELERYSDGSIRIWVPAKLFSITMSKQEAAQLREFLEESEASEKGCFRSRIEEIK